MGAKVNVTLSDGRQCQMSADQTCSPGTLTEIAEREGLVERSDAARLALFPRLVAMLEKLEWHEFTFQENRQDECNCCGALEGYLGSNRKRGGHWPHCELAALLAEARKLQ